MYNKIIIVYGIFSTANTCALSHILVKFAFLNVQCSCMALEEILYLFFTIVVKFAFFFNCRSLLPPVHCCKVYFSSFQLYGSGDVSVIFVKFAFLSRSKMLSSPDGHLKGQSRLSIIKRGSEEVL